ncbi:MAG: T9SS type A sorting domain-containing protein [Prolixibacteraceae bacterium]|nr:T9SS type A sorting domain-containing protein [Prolixibacteraceae bacterium]
MKFQRIKILFFIFCIICLNVLFVNGQNQTNCFLNDFEPKSATIPVFELADKTLEAPNVTVKIYADTLSKISRYIFGNAWAVWVGNVTNDPVLLNNVQTLNPSLIRFPGGSWADIFFWNGNPADIPDSIYDGTTSKKTKFYAISGKNDWPTTTANYYKMREETGSRGLISINYGYARYGLSEKPAEQAAHMAAEWVRFDNGRTKFWEIGNENAGPWEAGWMIDTSTNKDDQPKVITGELYGKHFKIFADSMRAAATEIGAEIYIGGQVLHFDGTDSWNSPDRKWNEGFFREVGDAADFYVMHNYYGSGATVNNVLSAALSEPQKNIEFIRQDIENKNASYKPVAVTEYNMNHNDSNPQMTVSFINGIQAVILFNEFIENNYGLAARWLLVTGESGMFYDGDNTSLRWQPRPDFYYAYYQQKFTGDHAVSTSSNNSNILAYASKFASGETGVVIVNKGTTDRIVSIKPTDIPVGEKYYCYTLTGGSDNGDFSFYVSINDESPSGTQWGPRENLENIPAKAYFIEDDILVDSPARSVQFLLLDSGDKLMHTKQIAVLDDLPALHCFPNPFSANTTIEFQISAPDVVSLEIYNQTGSKTSTLVHAPLPGGIHTFHFNRNSLADGIYFCKLQTGKYTITQKIVLMK